MKIFHSYPSWQLSGVGHWSLDLIKGLEGSGYDQRILLTGLEDENAGPWSVPEGVLCEDIRLPRGTPFHVQWKSLATHLTFHAPCIYLPNFDFDRACAVGLLPPSVAVCAVLHSDEPVYYENAGRLGGDWDGVVAVSEHIKNETARKHPGLAARLCCIPHGVELSTGRTAAVGGNHPLRLLYGNRLSQYQKKVFDLPLVMTALKEMNVPFTLTVAGDGPDAAELADRFQKAGLSPQVTQTGRLSRKELRRVMAECDVFLLTSDFEGLPISLLEAMAEGCVPVCYRTESGVGEVIQSGRNGILIPPGQPRSMAEALAELHRNRQNLRGLSESAVRTIEDHFSLSRMCAAYNTLFHELSRKARAGQCRSRTGGVKSPPRFRLSNRILQKLRSCLGLRHTFNT